MYIESDKVPVNEVLLNLIKNNTEVLKTSSSECVNLLRDKAQQSFTEQGIPTLKNENYKYTDLSLVFSKKYNFHFVPKKIDFNIRDMFRCDIPELDTHLIILLNGWYYTDNDPLTEYENGILMGSFARAAEKYPRIFEKYYGQCARYQDDGTVALNTALVQDGIFIYVPDGVVLERPVQVVNIVMDNEDCLVNHRNLIIAGKNSRLNVVICDHSLSSNQFLTNSVTEIFADENSVFDYTKVQNEHNGAAQISSTFINQKKNSNVSTNTISLHGGFIRNNIYALLSEPGCENNMYGLYLSDKFQHIDNNTFIDHASHDCTSNQKFKGVLDDMATGAFNGRIVVRKDAQHSKAYQANNNILLTDDAKINTKPQLEIYADDVKCSHGATVGQLDENSMFYLQSRGIGKKEARLMLMTAFANEIIKQINVEPLRERIDELVDKRLHGELSRCNSCAMHCN